MVTRVGALFYGIQMTPAVNELERPRKGAGGPAVTIAPVLSILPKKGRVERPSWSHGVNVFR
jgi:hypothetical protein